MRTIYSVVIGTLILAVFLWMPLFTVFIIMLPFLFDKGLVKPRAIPRPTCFYSEKLQAYTHCEDEK